MRPLDLREVDFRDVDLRDVDLRADVLRPDDLRAEDLRPDVLRAADLRLEALLLEDLRLEDLLLEDLRDLRGGTFSPLRRASDRPMAIACLRLLTFRPLRPLRSVPLERFFMARSTFFDAPREYFRAIGRPPLDQFSRSPLRRAPQFVTAV